MERFVRTVFTSFTIWVATALVNAVLVAAWSLFVSRYSGECLSVFGMVVVCTLLLSIPGMFIFWIFFISNYREEGLFQQLLQAALFISFISVFIFFGLIGTGFPGEAWWFGISAVLAAISSIMIHHPVIVNIVNDSKNNPMYKFIVSIRSAVLVFLTHQVALPVLRIIRKPEKFPYSKEELQQLPEGILGKDLVNMLEAKKLPLLSYYVKHDIKHILLGYDTTDEGEVCLQSFMLGNGHISFPVFITVVFGFATIPEHWSKFTEAYKRGRRSARISHWQWFQIIRQPTQSLISIVNRHEKNE